MASIELDAHKLLGFIAADANTAAVAPQAGAEIGGKPSIKSQATSKIGTKKRT